MHRRLASGLVVVLALAAGGFWFARRQATAYARDQINHALTRVAAYADVDYRDVRVDLFRRAAHVVGLTVHPVGSELRIAIDDLDISGVGDADTTPRDLDLTLHGITLPLPESDKDPLAAMGLDTLAGELTLRYRYDPTTQVLDIPRIGVSISGLADVEIGLRIAGVPPEGLPIPLTSVIDDLAAGRTDDLLAHAGPSLAAVAVQGFKQLHDTALSAADFRYEDRGLLPRLVVARSALQHVEPERVAMMLRTMWAAALSNMGPVLDDSTREALAKFVDRPGAIHLTMTPTVPIPIMRFIVGAAAGSPPDLRMSTNVTDGPELLASASEQSPRALDLLRARARAAIERHDWATADEAVANAIALAPNDTQLRLLREQVARSASERPAAGALPRLADHPAEPPAASPPRPERPASSATAAIAAPDSPPRASTEAVARDFVAAYFAHWSENNATALPRLADAYADPCEYFGKLVNRDVVLDEKRRFAERWPIRRYATRPESVSATCTDGACVVEGLVDWDCRSDQRHAASNGVATFGVRLRMTGGLPPRIIGEWSKVISRGPSR